VGNEILRPIDADTAHAIEGRPQGKRFSFVLSAASPHTTGERMRHRIGALIYEFDKLRRDLSDEIEREMGIECFPPFALA
jgi:hypothetical protein